jgi:hypothetical protein
MGAGCMGSGSAYHPSRDSMQDGLRKSGFVKVVDERGAGFSCQGLGGKPTDTEYRLLADRLPPDVENVARSELLVVEVPDENTAAHCLASFVDGTVHGTNSQPIRKDAYLPDTWERPASFPHTSYGVLRDGDYNLVFRKGTVLFLGFSSNRADAKLLAMSALDVAGER